MSKNIILCLKPVSKALFKMTNQGEQDPFQMNPYDSMALKNLVSIKQINADIKIICICMGSRSAECILRRALALGADDAYLISDRLFAGSDTVATTYILGQAIKQFDNVIAVICGIKSIDGETGQVPQGLGERLSIRRIIRADNIIELTDSKITYQKSDTDKIYTMQTHLPVIVRYNNFILKADDISLIAMKRAKKKSIRYLNAEDVGADTSRCGLKGSRTKVRKTSKRFDKQKDKVILEGTVTEIAQKIRDILVR